MKFKIIKAHKDDAHFRAQSEAAHEEDPRFKSQSEDELAARLADTYEGDLHESVLGPPYFGGFATSLTRKWPHGAPRTFYFLAVEIEEVK